MEPGPLRLSARTVYRQLSARKQLATKRIGCKPRSGAAASMTITLLQRAKQGQPRQESHLEASRRRRSRRSAYLTARGPRAGKAHRVTRPDSHIENCCGRPFWIWLSVSGHRQFGGGDPYLPARPRYSKSNGPRLSGSARSTTIASLPWKAMNSCSAPAMPASSSPVTGSFGSR
jgi:hypothetical protein